MAAKLTAMSRNMCIPLLSRVTPCLQSLSKTLHTFHRNVKYKEMTSHCSSRNLAISHPHDRFYSHHPTPFPYPEIPNPDAAKSFAVHLDHRGRSLLLEELSKIKEEEDRSNNVSAVPIIARLTRSQLLSVYLFHGIPFIGFGILDNMIMIIAGEYIDVTIGAMLGITTMAAAALGNLISDLAGIGTAGYVELMASKVGVKPPDITPDQALSRQARWAIGWGRSIGIAVGCIIGMFPLLFFKKKDHEDDEQENAKEDKEVQTDGLKSS